MLKNLFKSAFKVNRKGDTCHKVENLDAEWKKGVVSVDIPLIQIPITKEVTKTIVTKEAGSRRYYKCNEDGSLEICTETFPEETETVTYLIVTGYEVVQAQDVKDIGIQTLVSNGDIVENC